MKLVNRSIVLATIATVLLVQFSIAQSQLDSLRRELLLPGLPDTTRSLIYMEIGNRYVSVESDSAFYYCNEGLRLAQSIDFEKGQGWNMFWLSVYFRYTGSTPQALQLATKALVLFNSLGDHYGIFFCTQMQGWTAQDQEDFPRALHFSFEAAAVAEKNDFPLYRSYCTIAEIYNSLNKTDSALLYANKAYEMVGHRNNWPNRVFASIYHKLGDNELALGYYRKAIAASDVNHSFASLLVGFAELLDQMDQPDSCIHYASRALFIARRNRFFKEVGDASGLLAKIYSEKNEKDSVIKYMQQSLLVRDSIFSLAKSREFQNLVFNEQIQQHELNASRIQSVARTRIYILLVSMSFLSVLAVVLIRNNRNKQKANLILREQKEEIQSTLEKLEDTQSQLIQSEKMASLGELTAGIAHEIQNPLNFVNNFSEVNAELIDELKKEWAVGSKQLAGELIDNIKANEEKINHHGKRADAIVKGMLQHSRSSSGVKEPTDINALCDEYLRLSYHGLRAKDKSFNAKFESDFDPSLEKITVVPQDIGRVVLNLINNAFYAVTEKNKQQQEGYEPTVTVSTKKLGDQVLIEVKDNGNGIPDSIKEKIFQPFFTTKPTGQGTGLGLSLSYDIVKAHGGELKVETREGEGSVFTILIK